METGQTRFNGDLRRIHSEAASEKIDATARSSEFSWAGYLTNIHKLLPRSK